MKRIQALFAAALTTALIGLGVFAIGVNAASNTDTVPVTDSPAQTQAATVSVSTAGAATTDQAQAQINQLQNLISQYQTREKQYQTEIQNLSQQAADTKAQADQLQQILLALQQRGVIRITNDGRITIRGGG